MKTILHLSRNLNEPLPLDLQQDDVRYPAELVQHFLETYTQPGDRVFDPFAGYGTTLIAAEALGRAAYGLELNVRKLEYARGRLKAPANLLSADARQLASLDLAQFDFTMTSPPYTSKDDALDPLSDYLQAGKGYSAYLKQMRAIFGQLKLLMKPAATVVVEAANIKRHGRVTTLAWDLAAEISQVLRFDGEVVILWDQAGYGYDHSYCLVFSAI